jgi:phenylalanyl-tRNA synthetase alpha chain
MQHILDKIETLKNEIREAAIQNQEDLEKYRIRFLGTKGLVKELMGEMKNVSSELKKDFGLKMNEFKVFAETKYNEFKDSSIESNEQTSSIDFSLPSYPAEIGARHPIQLTMNKMISIFEKIGFSVAEGPEIEDDWHNFNALNLPENHPARDMQDTFYISKEPDWLLRTHTSSVQVRAMKEGKLPLRQIFPGRVYRNETISALSLIHI